MGIQHIMPKFHACWQTQKPRLGQPCNHQAPSQFFFDFSQALGHPINSLALIFHGYTYKLEISAHFALFSLKERARKPPWVFLLSPWVHTHQKKDKSPSYLLFDSFKATTTIKNSLPLSFPRVQHQKKQKLSTLFPLSHLWVQQQGKMFLSILLKLLYPTWS